MATEVDQKIVEMRFDNKQFDAGVKETMTLLEKFQSALSFKGATKGMEEIQTAANKVNLSNLEKSATAISVQFDAMQAVVLTAISRVTNAAINMGTQLTKSLTVEPITSGFSKYEDKLVSVRTIMSATRKSVDEVNDQLDRLVWFTDQTSYNFVDMVSNVGKFTNAGVELKDSITAMQGIANWAALSGQGITQASHAMYNLSQAMGTGAVKLQDWKSIEAVNMHTVEFKQNVLDTAVALGTLTKVGDKYYTALKKNEVSVTKFNDYLAENWFTSDVLMRVLSTYGEFADEVYNTVQETGRRTEDVLEELSAKTDSVGKRAFLAGQEYKTLSDAINATKDAVSTGWMTTFETIIGNTEQAKEVWTAVGEEIYSIFAAGAEYRNQVLASWAALDEGLGGRSDLFNAIGELWSNLREIAEAAGKAFRDVFPQYTVENIQNLVKSFASFTSQLKASEGTLYTIQTIVKTILVPFKLLSQAVSTVAQIFGTLIVIAFKMVDALLSAASASGGLSKVFKDLFGEERYERFVTALTGALSNLSGMLYKVASSFAGLLKNIASSGKIQQAFSSLVKVLTPLANWILDRVIDGLDAIANINFDKFLSIGSEILKGPVYAFQALNSVISNLRLSLKELGEKALANFAKNTRNNLAVIGIGAGAVSQSVMSLEPVVDVVEEVSTATSEASSTVTSSLSDITKSLSGILEKIKPFTDAVVDMVSRLTPQKILLYSFGIAVVGVVNSFMKINAAITDFINTSKDTVKNLVNSFSDVVKSFKSVLDNTATSIKILSESFAARLKPDTFGKTATSILKLAGAIAILSAIMYVFSKTPLEELEKGGVALAALAGGFVAMIAAFALINKFLINTNELRASFAAITMNLIALAVSVTILSGALKKLSTVEIKNPVFVVATLSATVLGIIAAVKIINKSTPEILASSALILAFGAAISMLVKAVSKLNATQLGSGLLNVVEILAAMGAFSLMLSKFFKSGASDLDVKMIVSMVSIVLGIHVLASALAILSNMEPRKLLTGVLNFIPVFVALGALALVAKLANGKMGNLGSMTSLGVGLIGIAAAVGILGMFKPETLVKGTITVAALMALMAAFLNLADYVLIHGNNNMRNVGPIFKSMSIAMLILSGVIAILGTMRLAVAIQGTAVISVLMGMFALVISSAKNVQKSMGVIISLTAALGMLTAMIAILSFLNLEEALTATLSLSALMLSLGVAVKLIGKAEFKPQSLASLMVAVATLAVIMYMITKMQPEAAIQSSAAISLVLLAIAGAVKITHGIRNDAASIKKFGLTIAEFTAVVAAVSALFRFVLKDIDGTNMIAQATALSMVLLAVSAATAIVSAMSGNTKIDMSVLGAIATLGVISGLLLVTLSAVAESNPENMLKSALSLSAILAAMSVSVGVLALVSKVSPDPASMANLMVAITLVSAIVGLLAAMFGQDEFYGLADQINRGADVLMAVGGAIGKFVGGVVGGVSGGASYTALTLLGEGLSNFMESAAPFIETMTSDGATIAGAIASLAGAILALTASQIVDGIASFLGFGESSLSRFGKELSEFAPYFKDFCDEIASGSGVDQDAVDAAINAGKAMAGFAKAIPSSGGKLESWFGDKSLPRFGNDMYGFAKYFVKFADKISEADINTSLIDNATNSAKALAGFAQKVPSYGGAIATWTGEKSLEHFGADLKAFAEPFAEYCSIITAADINTSLVNKTTDSAKALAEFASELAPKNGFIQTLIGQKDSLSTFGEELKDFGKYIAKYYEHITKINADIKPKTKAIAEAVDALYSVLPNEDPQWAKNIFGGVDMSGFGDDLEDLGGALSAFYDSVVAIPEGAFDVALAGLTSIANFADRFKLLDTTGLVMLNSGMRALGINTITDFLDGFSKATEDIDAAAVAFTNAFTAAVATKMEGLKDTALQLAITFAQGMNEQATIDMLEVTGGNIIWQVNQGATKKLSTVQLIGEAIVDGVTNGIAAKKETATRAMELLCQEIITTAETVFDEHSPSKVFHQIGEYVVQGLVNGIGDSETVATKVTKTISNAVLGTFSKIFKINSPSVVMNEMGHYLVQGLAEGITSDMSAVEAASKMASNITSAFQSAFDSLDLNKNTLDLEHQLWTSLYGGTASADEISSREAELQEKKMRMQAERVAYANAQYQAAIQAFGQDSAETQKIYNSYLQEMINLTDMAQTMVDNQTTASTDQKQAINDYIDFMENQADDLVKMGFTLEEVQEYAKQSTGFRFPGEETAAKTVSDIVDSYMQAVESVTIDTDIETALKNAVSKSTSAGASAGAYSGMTGGFTTGINEAVASLSEGESPLNQVFTNMFSMIGIDKDTTENSIMSFLNNVDDGILAKGGEIITNFGNIATESLSKVASAWGMDLGTKKSEEFEAIAEGTVDSMSDGVKSEAARERLAEAYDEVIDNANTKLEIPADSPRNPGTVYSESYQDGIAGNATNMVKTSSKVLSEVANVSAGASSSDYYSGGKHCGEMIVKGIVAGMEENAKIAKAAAVELARATQAATEAALQVKSPSRVFKRIGMYVDQGFANGILEYSDIVGEASKTMSEESITSMTDVIKQASELAGDTLDGDPIIRPVLDLDEMRKGVQELNMMFTRDQAISAHADIEQTRSLTRNRQNGAGEEDDSSKSNIFNFTQNNYSPKSLSRAEIFRQTRNQFAAFKERVSLTK